MARRHLRPTPVIDQSLTVLEYRLAAAITDGVT